MNQRSHYAFSTRFAWPALSIIALVISLTPLHAQTANILPTFTPTGNQQLDGFCDQTRRLYESILATNNKLASANENLAELLNNPTYFVQKELSKVTSNAGVTIPPGEEYQMRGQTDEVIERMKEIKSGLIQLPEQLTDILKQGQDLIVKASQLPTVARSLSVFKVPEALNSILIAVKYLTASVESAQRIKPNLLRTLNILNDLISGKPVVVSTAELETATDLAGSRTKEELLKDMNDQYNAREFESSLESAYKAYMLDPKGKVAFNIVNMIIRQHYSELSAPILIKIIRSMPEAFREFQFINIAQYYRRNDTTRVAKALEEIGTSEMNLNILGVIVAEIDPETNLSMFDRMVAKSSIPLVDFTAKSIIPKPRKDLSVGDLVLGAEFAIGRDLFDSFGPFIQRIADFTSDSVKSNAKAIGSLFRRCLLDHNPAYLNTFIGKGLIKFVHQSLLVTSVAKYADRLVQYQSVIEDIDMGADESIGGYYTKAKLFALAKNAGKYSYYYRRVTEIGEQFDSNIQHGVYYGISCLLTGQIRRAEIIVDHVFAYGKDKDRKFLQDELKWYIVHDIARIQILPIMVRYGFTAK